jgi:hypothetical protein
VSAVIAVLMVFTSLGGLFLPDLYRDNTPTTTSPFTSTTPTPTPPAT